jgi:basic membrane protein A and related proteins
MYKNLAATLVAACFSIATMAQTVPTSIKPNSAEAGTGAVTGNAKPPLKIGFLYVAPLTPAGWVRQHEEGRRAMDAALNPVGKPAQVQSHYVENVAEGADAERVIRDLAQQGYGLIFTPSFGYMAPTLKVAAEFPSVKFESITGYKTAPNVATANARYYEGRYLAGIAAGRMSTSNTAGYVAGFPIPEVLQGINAFTLGMRSVNPKAEVKVVWLNVWFDPAKERDAAMTLMNQGADVLAFHTGSNAVMVAAQERGKLAVAYHSDMRAVAPDAQLLAVTHQWGDYYSRRAKAVLADTWESGQVWGGIANGMIRVGEFGTKVPKAVQTEVLALQKDIASGKRKPFAGPIQNNEGEAVIGKGQSLNDGQILQMNYFVQGVVGTLPKP